MASCSSFLGFTAIMGRHREQDVATHPAQARDGPSGEGAVATDDWTQSPTAQRSVRGLAATGALEVKARCPANSPRMPTRKIGEPKNPGAPGSTRVVVGGTIILPGVGYVEMAFAASPGQALTAIAFLRPCVLPEHGRGEKCVLRCTRQGSGTL